MNNYDYFKELGINDNVNKEWAVAFITEQKILYGEMPSPQYIQESWERNKVYFETRKGKPFLEITS